MSTVYRIRLHNPDEGLDIEVPCREDQSILEAAEAKGISNCPLCAIGHDGVKSKVHKLDDMDADHVAAWSKGGATSPENCQMLCKSHNRAKGNK